MQGPRGAHKDRGAHKGASHKGPGGHTRARPITVQGAQGSMGAYKGTALGALGARKGPVPQEPGPQGPRWPCPQGPMGVPQWPCP